MPQSYTSLHYHLVFSTKHREPTIVPELRPRLDEYIGGLVRGEGGAVLAIGGIPDHLHLLVRLRQDRAVGRAARGEDERVQVGARELPGRAPGVVAERVRRCLPSAGHWSIS